MKFATKLELFAPLKIKIQMKILRIYSLFFLFCFVLISCTTEFGSNCISGTQSIEKRIVDLEALTKIDLAIPGNLHVQEGATQFIEIEAPSDIIDKILNESQIGSERWIIELNDCYDGEKINVWVTLPRFIALDVSGSGNIISLDTLKNVESLNLEIDGSGDMEIQIEDGQKLDLEIAGSGSLDVVSRNIINHSYDINGSGDIISQFNEGQTMRMRIQGSGNIEAVGIVNEQFIEIEGQGDIMGFGLCANSCEIESKGSGNCEVKVNDTLLVRIEGSGDVCYKGTPAVTTSIDGSGDIKNCD